MNQDKTVKLPFEEALDKTGSGAYDRRCAGLCVVAVIAYACVSYGGTILVPAGACELGTTHAQQGILLAAPFMSGVVGSVMWGYLGDTRGRRRMLLVTLSAAALLNAVASFAVGWRMLLAVQLCSTLLSSGIYPLAMTLVSESVGRARRDRTLLLMSSFMLCSQGVMAGLAIPIIPLPFSYYIPALGIYWNSWRTLMLAYSVPCIVALLGISFFIQESPKFVLVNGNEDEALRILKTIHMVNKSPCEFQVCGVTLEAEESAARESGGGGARESGGGGARESGGGGAREQWLPLFRAPLRRYTLLMTLLFIGMQFVGGFLIWLPKVSNQFSKLLQTGQGSDMNLCAVIERSLHEEQQQTLTAPVPPLGVSCTINVTALLMVLVVCSLQFVSNGILSLVVSRFGRRNSVMVLVALCGACGALVPAVPHAGASAALYAGFLVGVIVIGPYTAISVALFPTHLRALAVAVTITGGRLCGFFTIQAANYLLVHSCRLGFLIFAAVFASSVLILSQLPNDRRQIKKKQLEAEEGVPLKLIDK